MLHLRRRSDACSGQLFCFRQIGSQQFRQRKQPALKNFFSTINAGLRDNLFADDDTAVHLKLTELVYLILSQGECCLKSKILSNMDLTKENFEQIVHNSIFTDISIEELAAKCNAPVIAADATSVADLEHLVDEAMKHFGGPFDFALHSIGMSPNVRKGRTYDDLDYDYLQKTLDISAISFHKMIQVLRKKDALREWGSIVALSYIAAQRTLYGYNDMADAKALLESIARSFGYIYGREKHVRINTVSQSPTPTTAGNGVLGLKDLMEFAESMSPLGNASANDCADYVLTLFSDLTRKVTMQNLFHDGGFSSMGMSRRAMRTYEKGLRFEDVHEHQFPFGTGDNKEE